MLKSFSVRASIFRRFGTRPKSICKQIPLKIRTLAGIVVLFIGASPARVILSERMRVEALRSAGGAKPRNEVTKGSSKDYSLPILLLLFATEGRDPSTPLRSAQDDTAGLALLSLLQWDESKDIRLRVYLGMRCQPKPCTHKASRPSQSQSTFKAFPSRGRWHEPASDG